ncbi:hypothetical protein EU537_05085 [Candidatus Thorarchaeota archaeon]|nr:MAG: hypothetical protein EU537_05085 [Candidatus Thorarchaeota archaeon]
MDLANRGDFVAITKTYNDFWKDKNKNPLHRIDSIAMRNFQDADEVELTNTLLQIRSSVFSYLGLLSLSIATEVSTKDILQVMLNEDNSKKGRKKAREFLTAQAKQLIDKNRVNHLIPTELKRDGLGYLTEKVREAQIENYRKAKPSVKKGKLSLKKLSHTVLGKKILRDLCIDANELDANSDEASRIGEAYDHYLLEIELSEDFVMPDIEDTQQLSLEGKPLDADESDETKKPSGKRNEPDQENLTRYLAEDEAIPSSEKKNKG